MKSMNEVSMIYEKYTELLRENGILKNEIAEMQKSVHILQVRVKELNEELYNLKRENK